MSSFSQLPLADKLKQAQRGDIVVTSNGARLPLYDYDEEGNILVMWSLKRSFWIDDTDQINDIIRPSEREREVPEIVGKLRRCSNNLENQPLDTVRRVELSHLCAMLADHFEGEPK